MCGCFSEDLHTSNITDRIAPSKHEPLRKVLEVDIQYIIGYFWNFVNVISTIKDISRVKVGKWEFYLLDMIPRVLDSVAHISSM